MAAQILQVNFRFNVTTDEYQTLANEIAGAFAAVEGLRWKIWLLNEERQEGGGIYLFNDEASLATFLAGPLPAQVKNHPGPPSRTRTSTPRVPTALLARS